VLAAACTSNAPAGPTGPGPMPTNPVTLNFRWWGNATRAATTQKVIDAFQAKYPFFTVKGDSENLDSTYWSKLSTEFAGGTAPDVITMGGAYPLKYAADERLTSLDQVSTDLDT